MVLSKKTMVTAIVILFAVIAVVAAKFFMFTSVQKIDPVLARSKGPQKARVKIVEFIDLECPACAYGAGVLKKYISQYPQEIHVQIKFFPLLNVHRHALQVAAYAECVSRQDKFWPFFDALMPQQSQWSQLINAQGIFDQVASAAGADMVKIKDCVSSQDVTTSVMSDKSLGQSLGVQSTPTYFINDKMLVGSKGLEEELNKYFPKSNN